MILTCMTRSTYYYPLLLEFDFEYDHHSVTIIIPTLSNDYDQLCFCTIFFTTKNHGLFIIVYLYIYNSYFIPHMQPIVLEYLPTFTAKHGPVM